MSSFGCCLWWFIAGTLLGWLLHHLLSRCCCKSGTCPSQTETTLPPAAKVADIPSATITPVASPVADASQPATPAELTAKPKAPAKPKEPAKPKVPAKPKAAPKAKIIDIAAVKAAGFALKNADDLTVIEGIGPKINELFKDNGLKTFAQVAKATVPQMRTILDKGGSRFRIANPGSWAQQADLAANNKWTELKALQEKLSAGIEKQR